MSSNTDYINDLIEQKKQILLKKKSITVDDIDSKKELLKEYMRVQKKIQYYSNDEYRKNKITKVNEYNKSNKDIYNEYQKYYYTTIRKLNEVI
jgi:hypothetical protein